MKKLVIAAVLAAVGGGAYFALKNNQEFKDGISFKDGDSHVKGQVPNLDALNYAPAETLFFAGQLKAVDVEPYIKSIVQDKAQKEQIQSVIDELKASQGQEQAFFASLLQGHNDASSSVAALSAHHGFADKMRMLTYTIGLLPVIRYEVKDEGSLWKALDKAEQDSGLVSTENVVSGVKYKSYPIYADENGQFEFVASVNKGWVSLTLNTPFNTQSQLNQALALEEQAQSLANTTTLQDMASQHGFDGSNLGFLNHKTLVTGITSKDGNALASMLNKIFSAADINESSTLSTPECQTDLNAIANNWPRTAFGTQESANSDDVLQMKASAVIESKSTDILTALASIRGFIPAHMSPEQDKILGIALGLDVSQLSPMLTSLWEGFTQAPYKCEALVGMQEEMKQSNPMMIGMITGMLGSLKGISLSLMDVKFTNDGSGQPKIDVFDGLLTISAQNPASLFNSVKSFLPVGGDINLPSDGSSVSLEGIFPLPPEVFGPAPEMAVKGDHLVIYRGEKAKKHADALTSQTLDSNGFTQFSIDHQAFFTPLVEAAKLTGEEVPEEMLSLKDNKMKINFSMDYTKNGIEFTTEMENELN